MPKLVYVSLMRLPTERAHGLQIMQNCEAFAEAGCEVTLWVARRWNTRDMRRVQDPYAYYGVARNFAIRRVPCLDIFPIFRPDSAGARLAFYLLQITYAAVMLLCLPFVRADIYYSRDELLLALMSWLKGKDKVAYEAHLFPSSDRAGALQARVCRRAGSIIAITSQLRADLVELRGADPARVIVAHDGVKRARFENLPDRAAARRRVGWDEGALMVGYLGSLRMIGLDKGVGMLLQAVAKTPECHLALVGADAADAVQLREAWVSFGRDASEFHSVGRTPPGEAPMFLSALDICAMPHPATRQFARYTSPLKLFEYMAAGRAIVASDLPGWSDVVVDEASALLCPPDDIAAWTAAIARLRDDPQLRARLGETAREKALSEFTWSARADNILAHIAST